MSGAASSEVAFEVDNIDAPAKAGWSVVVHGEIRDVTRYDGLERQRAAKPWTGSKDFLIRIAPGRSRVDVPAPSQLEPSAFVRPSPISSPTASGISGVRAQTLVATVPPTGAPGSQTPGGPPTLEVPGQWLGAASVLPVIAQQPGWYRGSPRPTTQRVSGLGASR